MKNGHESYTSDTYTKLTLESYYKFHGLPIGFLPEACFSIPSTVNTRVEGDIGCVKSFFYRPDAAESAASIASETVKAQARARCAR